MEAVAATMEGEWSSVGEMFTTEEADFMAQVLGSNSGFGASSHCNNTTNHYNVSSNYGISDGSSFLNPSTSQDSYYLMSESNNSGLIDTNKSNTFDFYMDGHMNTTPFLIEDNEDPNRDMMDRTSEVSKKRLRGTDNVEKTKRNVRPKKNPKVATSSNNNNDEECNGGHKGAAASSSYCSEDDSNASLNLNGKTRASRGAATDPQSLYARRRRERINERLRILQKLVPNGTKVDISTMLEEAVHYVKFLQLQIKLLSSDDL